MKNISKALIILTSVILASCGSDKNGRDMSDYLSSFLYEDNTVIAYGSSDVETIIGKAGISEIEGVGAIVTQTINDFSAALEDEVKVYYAFEGPIDERKGPAATYFFIDVKNADSLVDRFGQMGYQFEDKNGMKISVQDGQVIGVKNDLAIGILSDIKDLNEESIVKAFKRANGKKQNEKVAEILEDDADIVLGSNLQALYETSDTELNKLDAEKRAKIEEYVKDSQYKTTVRFENGEAIISTKALVNDKLKDALFLKEQDNTELIEKLGPGKPKMALAVNMDILKMQHLAEEFSPGIMNEVYQEAGIPPFAVALLGPDGLGSMIDGKFAFALTGSVDTYGEVPQISAYVGLGKNAKLVTDMGKDFLTSQGANGSGDVFEYENMKARIAEDYIVLNTDASSISSSELGKTALSLPAYAKDFGTKPVTGFIDFTALENADEMMLELGDIKTALNILEFAYFEADNLESKMVIKAKDGKENILKQLVTTYMKELKK